MRKPFDTGAEFMRPMNLRSALGDLRRHKTGGSNVSYIAHGRLAEESPVYSRLNWLALS
jgi:hypothetical protein